MELRSCRVERHKGKQEGIISGPLSEPKESNKETLLRALDCKHESDGLRGRLDSPW